MEQYLKYINVLSDEDIVSVYQNVLESFFCMSNIEQLEQMAQIDALNASDNVLKSLVFNGIINRQIFLALEEKFQIIFQKNMLCANIDNPYNPDFISAVKKL